MFSSINRFVSYEVKLLHIIKILTFFADELLIDPIPVVGNLRNTWDTELQNNS